MMADVLVWVCRNCGGKQESVDKPETCAKCGVQSFGMVTEEDSKPDSQLSLQSTFKYPEDKENISRQIIKDLNVKVVRDGYDFYIWDGGVYKDRSAESYLNEKVRFYLGDKFKINAMREMHMLIKTDRAALIERDIINSTPVISLLNGMYHPIENRFFDADPAIINTIQLPVVYDSSAKCETILDVLGGVLPTPEDVKTFQEFMGYFLLRSQKYKKLMMVYGPKHSGKTTVMNIMCRFLGEKELCKDTGGTDNVSHVSLQSLCNPDRQFEQIKLMGKLANIVDDMGKGDLNDVAIIKNLTGGGVIEANRKGKESVNFFPSAKHIFATNQLARPRGGPEDVDAYIDRMILIRCANSFTGDKRNYDLVRKTLDMDQISGLFNWAVEGLLRLEQNRSFTISPETAKIKEAYEMNADPLRAFVKLFVVRDVDGVIDKNSFYDRYANWCLENELYVLKNETVGKNMKSLCPGISGSQRQIGDKKGVHVWTGYRMVDGDVNEMVIKNTNEFKGFFKEDGVVEEPMWKAKPKDPQDYPQE